MRGARGRGAEDRVREAFGAVRAPEGLRAQTLARIEEERRAEKDGGSPAASAGERGIVPFDPRAARRRRLRPRLVAAACLVLALLCAGGAYVAVTPTAYVDIDVNPSIELGVNRLDGVVSARALNEDGERVLSGVDVLWRSYDDAIDAIGDELEAEGYLTGESVVSVTVSCDDERQYDALAGASHACLGEVAGEVSCSHASEEEHREAHDAGMGVGKWRAWQELVGMGEDLSAEDAREMSMRELRDLCEEHASSAGDAASPGAAGEGGSGSGGGSGDGSAGHRHGDGGGHHAGRGGAHD